MQLSIQIPWLTRTRRIAIGVSLVLVLMVVALPASAAQPEGIEGEVIVMNGPDDPVPISGEVTAMVTGSVDVTGAVTIDNEAADPVPVSGSVTASQGGDWTVGLDLASQGHLSNIDAATAPLSYDADGNLNVNVAAGTLGGAEIQTADRLVAGEFGEPASTTGTHLFSGTDIGTVTAVSIYASESVVVRFELEDQLQFILRVDAGDTFGMTFPFPFQADAVAVTNLSDVDAVFYWLTVSGY